MIINQIEYNKMPVKNGGDLWNTYKLCRIVFTKHEQAEKIEFYMTTGLWVDVIVHFKDNTRIKERFFDR